MKKRKGGQQSKKDAEANVPQCNISEGSVESVYSFNSQSQFKNLYWTRVISLNNFKEDEDHVFSIQEDYNIEKLGFEEAILELDREAQILFDPVKIADGQNELLTSDFKIDDDQLRKYGSIFTDIRKQFEDQAIIYDSQMLIENREEE